MLTIEITHANWVTLRSISELSISHMNSLSMVPLWQGLRKLGLRTDSEFVSMPFATPSKHAKVSGASLLWFCRNFFFWHKRQIHFIYFLFFKNTNSQINIVTLWYHQNVHQIGALFLETLSLFCTAVKNLDCLLFAHIEFSEVNLHFTDNKYFVSSEFVFRNWRTGFSFFSSVTYCS